MMAFPGMLVHAAEKAGMLIPPNPDDFDPEQFPHFDVFCKVQLCRPIRWGEHWENAEIIQAVPLDQIKTITLTDLIERGLSIGG